MEEEILNKLTAFRDAVQKDANTPDGTELLAEIREAVRGGFVFDDMDGDYQDKVFGLIGDIDLVVMSDINRGIFDSAVDVLFDGEEEDEED